MPKTFIQYLEFIKNPPKNSQNEGYYRQVDNYIRTLKVGLEDEDITIRIICQRGLVEYAENVRT